MHRGFKKVNTETFRRLLTELDNADGKSDGITAANAKTIKIYKDYLAGNAAKLEASEAAETQLINKIGAKTYAKYAEWSDSGGFDERGHSIFPDSSKKELIRPMKQADRQNAIETYKIRHELRDLRDTKVMLESISILGGHKDAKEIVRPDGSHLRAAILPDGREWSGTRFDVGTVLKTLKKIEASGGALEPHDPNFKFEMGDLDPSFAKPVASKNATPKKGR